MKAEPTTRQRTKLDVKYFSYSQELTSEVILVVKESNTRVTYHAAQLMLYSSPMLPRT